MLKYTLLNVGIILSMLSQAVALADIVNQASSDVMVLRAEVVGTVASSGASDIAKERCASRRDLSGGQWLDCTAAIAEKYGAPAIHGIVLPVGGDVSCGIMRIKTLSKQLAAASSEGIGFSHGQKGHPNRVSFVALDRLAKVTEMPLSNGMVGDVHQFVAISSCRKGNANITYQFRPFLGFKTSQGSKFRNWDSFGFYEIPKDKNGFDQSSIINQRVSDTSILENAQSTGQKEIFGDGNSVPSGSDGFLYGD
jgi:hypothetical protein